MPSHSADLSGFARAKQEETSAADGVMARAGVVGGRGDAAEQDEPVPEHSPETVVFAHCRSHHHHLIRMQPGASFCREQELAVAFIGHMIH
jgi:hypothetical protein